MQYNGWEEKNNRRNTYNLPNSPLISILITVFKEFPEEEVAGTQGLISLAGKDAGGCSWKDAGVASPVLPRNAAFTSEVQDTCNSPVSAGQNEHQTQAAHPQVDVKPEGDRKSVV